MTREKFMSLSEMNLSQKEWRFEGLSDRGLYVKVSEDDKRDNW